MQTSESNPHQQEEVNNHVHSTYSFSPYSPTQITKAAVEAGLKTVGLMDHDTIAGGPEFLAAARSNGIAATVGCEIRVHLTGTPLEGKRVNNPDEPNIIYIAFHGTPANQFEATDHFLKPIRTARLKRSQAETEKLNAWLEEHQSPTLNFATDVQPCSRIQEGGTITERHICFSLAKKLIHQHGTGEALILFLKNQWGLPLSQKIMHQLQEESNPHRIYDLLGFLKAELVPHFFIPSGTDECPSAHDAAAFARSIHAIPAYAYLGDISESPTGDKRAQRFEDSFLDQLISTLKELGFQAITYMPPRNTREQLHRLQQLCRQHGLMEISGVDINSSRQSFNCPLLLDPAFQHLCDAAWALIAHEKCAAQNETLSLFHPKNPRIDQSLETRVQHYAAIGRKMNPHHPEKIKELL